MFCPGLKVDFIFFFGFSRVAHSPACRMPVDNLAKVFGPTIVGYSSEDLSDAAVFSETTQQAKVCFLFEFWKDGFVMFFFY